MPKIRKKIKRIKYNKHTEDPNIWFSDRLNIKKYKAVVIINWNTHTFEIINAETTESVFSGEKTGTHYVALLRRIKNTLIKLGAKFETKKRKLSKNKRKSSR